VGDARPLTSFDRQRATIEAARTFLTTVTATAQITPRLRQITFAGGLDTFESLGADQFLYVLLPPRGTSELTVGTDFTWEAARAMSDDVRPTGAYYTVRSWRPDVGEIDAWFVLHGDSGDASVWAARVEPGAPAALWGPRTAYAPPTATSSFLLAVDETGYAAAAAILDDILAVSPAAGVTVLAECDDSPVDGIFASGTNVEVRWCSRAGQPPGTSSVLPDTVRGLDIDGGVYAYGGAESKQITAVRRHLRDERGLGSEQVSMTGYWRR
jgi:NADPH-dependent ferric siderophore reductase